MEQNYTCDTTKFLKGCKEEYSGGTIIHGLGKIDILLCLMILSHNKNNVMKHKQIINNKSMNI